MSFIPVPEEGGGGSVDLAAYEGPSISLTATTDIGVVIDSLADESTVTISNSGNASVTSVNANSADSTLMLTANGANGSVLIMAAEVGGSITFTDPEGSLTLDEIRDGLGGGGEGFTEVSPDVWAFVKADGSVAIVGMGPTGTDGSVGLQASLEASILVTGENGTINLEVADGVLSMQDESGATNLGELIAKADSANAKGFVNHGATAGTARPSGYASIEWYGSVEPTNAVDGDTWIDTSA